MPKIELQYLLRQTSTPEQQLFLSWFYSNFDNDSAAHKRILSVEPIYYQGVIAGSEFLVYAATKLYLCYSLDINEIGAYTDVVSRILFYDENDTLSQYANNEKPFYDVAGNKIYMVHGMINLKNNYFSRFNVVNGYTYMKFLGYRIILN